MINKSYKVGKFVKQNFNILAIKNNKVGEEVVSGEVNGYFGLHRNEDDNLVITHLPSGKLVIYSDFDTLSLEAPNRKAYELPDDTELTSKFKEIIARLNTLKGINEKVIPSDRHFKIRTTLRAVMFYDKLTVI